MLYAVLGVAAIALGIIGPAETSHGVQVYLDAIAVIVLSAALLATSAQLLGGFARRVAAGAEGLSTGGIMVDFYLGAGTLILDILALLHRSHPRY